MSLVDRIELRIKERGLNFKRVEQECGLGNGTIKRWETQSPRLDKLVLVSEYLQISLDYLVFGDGELKSSLNRIAFSNTEINLITLYRQLDMRDQNNILGHIKMLLEHAATRGNYTRTNYSKDGENGSQNEIKNSSIIA